jgi:hypothetical protein
MWLGAHPVCDPLSIWDPYSGGKATGCGTDHAHTSSVEVMGRDVHSLPRMPSWPAQGQLYLYFKGTENIRYCLFTLSLPHREITASSLKEKFVNFRKNTPFYCRNQKEHTTALCTFLSHRKHRVSLQRSFCYISGESCCFL